MNPFTSPTSRKSVVDALKQEGFQDTVLKDSTSTHSPTSKETADIEAGNVIKPKQTALLGTLNGVFLPCVQNILGVILFLRLPFITAQAGCLQTSAIILICVLSTLLTALSLSAIATNGQILGGGPYYVISRTLGKEIGGALGLLFYLGTTIAASMYTLGAIEAIQSGFNVGALFSFDTQTEALVLMLIIAGTVAVGVKYVNIAAPLFLGIVLVSIFCLSLGCILFAAGAYDGELDASSKRFGDNMMPQYSPDPDTGKTPSFLSLLALFFPSVTGIMAGSNRSAVLADPSRSIPRGTLSAIGVTTVIYLFVVWLFGSVLSHETLLNDKLVVTAVAWPAGIVVRIGIIMSSVGAALQCVAGAPRLLAAIAADDCIGFLRIVKPESDADSANPIKAVFVTWMIASIPCLAGNLDVITPIISMFFLLMYGAINLSCFMLSILKAPSFRPTFKYFHWFISLAGCLFCLGLAFTISYIVALGAIALMSVLFAYILKTQSKSGDFGDIAHGIRYTACHALLKQMIDVDEIHPKNWRPLLLTIIQADRHGIVPASDSSLIRLGSQLKKGRGMNMVVAVMEGSMLDPESKEAAKHAKLELQKQMSIEGLAAFTPDVALSPASGDGVTTRHSETIGLVARHAGIGPLRPNTVLLSWPQNARSDEGMDLVHSLQHLAEAKKTILVLRGSQSFPGDFDRVKHETIDVFWLCHDGGLLLLLPFLLSKNAVWRGSRLRLFAGVTSIVRDLDRFKDAIQEHLQKARIEADVQVIDISQLQDTVAIDTPAAALDSDADDEAVEGTLLYQILSPQKEAKSAPVDISEIESSLDRSLDSITTEQATPRQRLAFGDVVDDDVAAGDDDNASQGLDSVAESIVGRATAGARSHSNNISSAVALNQAIRSHSDGTVRLVVTNLPLLRPSTRPQDFVDYVNAMCSGLDNVLLVRGAGNEVITHYA